MLFVDGAQVASDPTTTTAQNFSGYWRAGYDALTFWSPLPTSYFFNGVLDEVRFIHSALSADQIKLDYQTQKPSGEVAVSYPNTALSTWSYTTKVYVNTTATGANTTTNVTGFPLLVRLNASNFNFAQAQANGGDLRFAKADGTLMPYQIERWSNTADSAEIWVLVDTVYANNNSQYFNMYWGKNTATSLSSGQAVFNSNNGFIADWHLNEVGNTTTAGYADAVGRSPATGTAMTSGTQVGSDIAQGQTFNGSTQYLTAPSATANVNIANGSFTLSGWVNRAATGSLNFLIGQGGGVNDSGLQFGYRNTDYFTLGLWNDDLNSSATNTNTGVWQYWTATFNSSSKLQTLYYNGVYNNSRTAGAVYKGTGNLNIGEFLSSNYWNGGLDEISISTTVRSADWVKLCYQTQVRGATAVTVGYASGDYTNSVILNFNTTSSGANVSANVTNIPILVTLSSSNFDFTKVRDDAKDILFVDPDGTRLYHEVVQWDKANQNGKVWVKVPQVDGNSSTDYIKLYYGCAACSGNPQERPDSLWKNYKSVYHLEGTKDKAYDATALANNGTYFKNMANIAGLTTQTALVFDGSTDYIDIPKESNYNFTTNIAVSTWVKIPAWTKTWQAIVTKADNAYRLQRNNTSNAAYFAISIGGIAYGTSSSAVNVADGNWHYVVGTYDGSNVRLFVDGSKDGSAISVTGNVDTNSADLYIGENLGQTGRQFNGEISEVRLSNTTAALDSNYIKLSYQNQKPNSTFMTTAVTTASFQHSKIFKFNTTSTGANVAGDVYNFPVLIRLTGSTIIGACQSAGQDIRFLASDGVTWLPYQIERWKTTATDSAEIWVLVPKIAGNSTSSYITMYYQQASGVTAPDGQCATCVFSTANGFTGVWHMNDTAASATVSEVVAAQNGTYKNNTTNDNTSNHTVAGVIGRGLDFQGGTAGDASATQADNFTHTLQWPKTTGTISHWVKPDQVRTMVTMYESNGTTATTYNGLGINGTDALECNLGINGTGYNLSYQDGTDGVTGNLTGGTATAGAWAHVAATWDRTGSAKLYVNGAMVASSTISGVAFTSKTPTVMQVGRVGDATDSRYWDGVIDEIEVSNVVRDSNWIKLAYQNQRTDATPLFNPSPSDFQHTKKFIFNTTKTGANVLSNVTNFPLLVRITGGGITAAVQTNAPDIRFLDGDGKTWLNYQIERWSTSPDSAEVWVLVPQIDGNSDHDFITLYYQQASGVTVPDGQCGTCVFSTANGYVADWHLNTSGTGSRPDATANSLSLTTNNYTGSEYTGGIIAGCDSLDGVSKYLSAPSGFADWSNGFTYTGWAYWASTGSYARLFDFGNGTHSDNLWSGRNSTGTTWSADVYNGSSDGIAVNATSALATGVWAHFAVTFNGTAIKMYKNGSLIQSGTSALPPNVITRTSNFLGHSNWSADAYYQGKFDEVAIANTVRDSNWIKLSYQTQRATGNVFWNSRPGPDNNAVLTCNAAVGGIQCSWGASITDSTNADSIGIWVKYQATSTAYSNTYFPDSAGVGTLVTRKAISTTDTTYLVPATYPNTYYFGLAIHNTAGKWSPINSSSSDTANIFQNLYGADTVYVDSAIGSDANSCATAANPATPKLTISSAVSNCTANDTVVVRVLPGTYTDNSFTINAKPTIIQAFDGQTRPTLNGSGSVSENSSTYYYTVAANSNIVLRNLDIKAGTNGYDGIYIRYNGTGITVDGCRIFNNGSTKHQTCIHIPSSTNQNILVANNLCYQPTSYGISVYNGRNQNFVNNLFFGSGGATEGFHYDGNATYTSSTVTNNIFYNFNYGIRNVYSSDIGLVSNNLFWQVTTGDEVAGETDANKIIKDPLLASTTLGDYNFGKLLPTSPAIDAGTASLVSGGYSVTTSHDLYGDARPTGAAPDIGVYEGTGYGNTTSGNFDTLITSTTASTVTVRNADWKIVFDKARGGGIDALYDGGDTTTNLLAANSLLFDVQIGSYKASAQTSNTITPILLAKNRAYAYVWQRLAVTASMDLDVYYTILPSGHIYVESQLRNLYAGTVAMDTVAYTTTVNNATAAYGNGGSDNGFGYLTTATRGLAVLATLPLDTGAAAAESWAQSTAAGSGGFVKWQTTAMASLAPHQIRTQSFLLYLGDKTPTYAKTASLYTEATAALPLHVYTGANWGERSWQDALYGHWPLDDASGTTVRDKAVYFQHNGALTGGTWTTGKWAGGLSLATTDVVSVNGNADSLDGYQDWSLCFWVDPDFTNMGNTAYFIDKGTSTANGYFVRKVSGQNQVTFNMGSGSVTVALNNNAWNYVIFTVTSGGQIYGYVNGIRVAAGTSIAAPVANSSNLHFGENAGSGSVDRFKGVLDDIRIYKRELSPEEIQSLYRRGFDPLDGLNRVRADNNNRVDLVLNDSAPQVHVQPMFYIDNWFAGRTPNYVYLNGTRLRPLVDFVSDTILQAVSSFGSKLVLQLNKTITTSQANLFIDDDDSTGYLGASSLMPALVTTYDAADHWLKVRNFPDTVFGAAGSNQWELIIDLNGSTTTNDGDGGIFSWKSSEISPYLALSQATDLTGPGQYTLDLMRYDNNSTTKYTSGNDYSSPNPLTYTILDSSSTRLKVKINAASLNVASPNLTLERTFTIYPTGKLFISHKWTSLSADATGTEVVLTGLANEDSNESVLGYTAATGKAGRLGGNTNLYFHSLGLSMLSVKPGSGSVVMNGSTVSSTDNSTAKTALLLNGYYTKTNVSAGGVYTNYMVDIARNYSDSASLDSALSSPQVSSQLMTAITGSLVTGDALDFNGDGFAEGEGAFVYQAASSGIAHFRFDATTPRVKPAFKITGWTFGGIPNYVIVNNQTQVPGYQYNATLDNTNSDVVLQFNHTFSGGIQDIYISHANGLAVTMNLLYTAADTGGHSGLNWVTQSEYDNLGYNVWRRTLPRPDTLTGALCDSLPIPMELSFTEDSLKSLGYVRLNTDLLPGAPDGRSSATRAYAYLDPLSQYGPSYYEYLLEAVDFQGNAAFYGPVKAAPADNLQTALYGNFPNPFNPVTFIRFALKDETPVSLIIYDFSGRVVKTLIRPDNPLKPGRYSLTWDATTNRGQLAASGPYFYRFIAGKFVATKKMILLK